jgi:hypothetical protein
MNNSIKNPQKYEAPAIEIFEVEVEKGFAATNSAPPAPNEPTDAGTGGGPWSEGGWG